MAAENGGWAKSTAPQTTQNRCYPTDSGAGDLAAEPEGNRVYVGATDAASGCPCCGSLDLSALSSGANCCASCGSTFAGKTVELRRYLVGVISDGLRARLVESPEINAQDLLAEYLTTWHTWQQVEANARKKLPSHETSVTEIGPIAPVMYRVGCTCGYYCDVSDQRSADAVAEHHYRTKHGEIE